MPGDTVAPVSVQRHGRTAETPSVAVAEGVADVVDDGMTGSVVWEPRQQTRNVDLALVHDSAAGAPGRALAKDLEEGVVSREPSRVGVDPGRGRQLDPSHAGHGVVELGIGATKEGGLPASHVETVPEH